jgi:hypothetical protein
MEDSRKNPYRIGLAISRLNVHDWVGFFYLSYADSCSVEKEKQKDGVEGWQKVFSSSC